MEKQGTAIISNINLGEFEVNLSQRIAFDEGLFGFEHIRNYYLVDSNMAPFMLLQSETDPAIGFIVCDPFLFFPDYEFNLDDNAKKNLGLDKPEDALVLMIVTLSDHLEEVSGNLVGPLVININTHRGMQYIISAAQYSTKHYLFGKSVKDSSSK